ncbi:MAG: glycosyltransferase [Eubacteriales bacterium]|nr:glycosyltransferase [Eubacteriales bacterium]
MNLGIVCTMVNGFGRKGFYNSQEIGLGRALRKLGNEVTIYKCIMKGETPSEETIEDGFSIHYIMMPSVGAHAYLDTHVLDKNLDGILCFADNQWFLPHIYKFCKNNRIAFVPYIGTTFSFYQNTLRGRVSDLIFKNGTLKLYSKIPVLAKTEGAIKELNGLGIKSDNITLAPVGLDEGLLHTDFEDADKAELKKELGFEPDDVVICNVSRLEHEKRPLELLDIFDRIKDKKKFKLIIVGKGSLVDEVKAKAERIAPGSVRVLSGVPYNEMWKIYTMSDYYVNMSIYEIFGMAIMEAVYYCASVAAITAPGPRITLKDMKGHKICETDEEIEEWLLKDHPDESVLKASSEKMLRDFSWRRCAEAFVGIVNSSKAKG